MTTLQDLAHLPIWVGWRTEYRQNGKGVRVKTKIPYCPRDGGMMAASNDPSTWATYNEAETWAIENRGDGVGFELTDISEELCTGAIDLDTCRDPETEEIAKFAREVLDWINSYSEISPSL